MLTGQRGTGSGIARVKEAFARMHDTSRVSGEVHARVPVRLMLSAVLW